VKLELDFSLIATTAITFEAGVQWIESYEAVRQRNRVIVGGICPQGSIGAAGGWLSGGGHSPVAPNYGLGTSNLPNLTEPYSYGSFTGVDNVLEITIVTADGDHVIANAYNNEDLFWALRGGGGGTWGIVTSVTYKTHPSNPFSTASLVANSTNANSTQNLLAEIIRLTPSLVDQGYGGCAVRFADQIQFSFISPNVTAEQTRVTFLPLFEFAASQPGLTVDNVTVLYPDFSAWYASTDTSSTTLVGIPTELSSWLLPKDVVQTDKPGELAAELLKTSSLLAYWWVFLTIREID